MRYRRQIDAAIARIGSLCLAIPPVCWLMNLAYNRGGFEFRYFFIRRFDRSPIRRPFRWVAVFHGKTWLMPVAPEPALSWHVALSCLSHEPELLRCHRLFMDNHRGPKIVFDVGANFGLMSYPFLAHGYECVMFEPQAVCASYIEQVAALNGFHPRVERCVLSAAPGEIDFYTSDSTWFSSVSKTAVEAYESARKQTVRALTLDAYCEQAGIVPALIKLDVEGHEWDVLRGGEKLFSGTRPTILVEIWPYQENKTTTFEFLRGNGYEAFGVTLDKLIPLRDTAEMSAFTGIDFLFCADESLLPVWRGA